MDILELYNFVYIYRSQLSQASRNKYLEEKDIPLKQRKGLQTRNNPSFHNDTIHFNF